MRDQSMRTALATGFRSSVARHRGRSLTAALIAVLLVPLGPGPIAHPAPAGSAAPMEHGTGAGGALADRLLATRAAAPAAAPARFAREPGLTATATAVGSTDAAPAPDAAPASPTA